jgi:hypothetical protein
MRANLIMMSEKCQATQRNFRVSFHFEAPPDFLQSDAKTLTRAGRESLADFLVKEVNSKM